MSLSIAGWRRGCLLMVAVAVLGTTGAVEPELKPADAASWDSLPARLRTRIKKNRSQRAGAAEEAWIARLPADLVVQANLPYLANTGSDPRLTRLDVFRPRLAGPPLPIVIFVHGGGMSAGDKSPAALVENKARFFPAHGFIFVSVNYRLAPEVRDPVLTRDVTAAVAYVRAHAAEWGGNPDALFIMGHSAGAQLVVQMITDGPLLAEFAVPPASLRGAVMIDTTLYDIPYAMTQRDGDDDGLQQEIVAMTYGTSPAHWAEVSPINRIAAGKPLPPLLLFHAADPASLSARTAGRFAEKVRAAGGKVSLEGAREKDHSHLGRDVGTEGDWITRVVMDFFRQSMP